MKKSLVIAAALALLSVPAFAQGGAPFNSSGSQAGGPLAGQQRAMGAPGGAPASSMAPMRTHKRMMMKKRMHRKMMHQRRMHRGM